MRIGELSERTGTSARMLRYYEEQGLVIPQRLPNGYRDYGEYLVDRVLQVRALLDSGIPTRLIAQIMPCLGTQRTIHPDDATTELLDVLEQQRAGMDRRIEVLTRNRDAIDDYTQAVAAIIDRRTADRERPGSHRTVPASA